MQEKAHLTTGGAIKQRSSNLELYRIVCMMLIVAHHCVVNSGLISTDPDTLKRCGPLFENPFCANSLILWTIGMWGKTGINCFLMITGYFMCNSSISMKKFIKLMSWIYFYSIIIYVIFLIAGYETLSPLRLAILVFPVWGFETNFTSCFIGFWLTIPFWNILIHNMTKRQHEILLCLLLGMYTILGSIPKFNVAMNYVTWFGVIYLLASYIRLYPHPIMLHKKLWSIVTIISILLAICSMIVMSYIFGSKAPCFFVSDSSKIFAVLVAVASFLWFKNIKISYSKLINAIGASTFGVLLIHANSDAMCQWLWKDTIDCVGHYDLPPLLLILYFLTSVVVIFFVCIIIDRIRILLVERPFFKWYDRNPRFVRLVNLLNKQ